MPTLAELKSAKTKAAPKDPVPGPDAPYDPEGDDPPEPEISGRPSGQRMPVTRVALDQQEDLLNVLWYGDGGTGKTTDVAAAANLGRILMINAEQGIKRRALERRGIDVSNIQIVPEPGTPLTFELLDTLFWDTMRELDSGDGPIAIVWDSITEITKKVLTAVIGKRVAKSERTGKGSTDPYFTDISDYGTMTEMMRELVRRYRDLPCHFLMTALERRDIDDDGKVIYRPQLTPAFANDVYGYADCVVHTDTIEDNHGADIFRGLTRPAGKFRAKDRLGALPKYLVDPTFERILGYVTEDLDADTDPVQLDAVERTKPEPAAKAE